MSGLKFWLSALVLSCTTAAFAAAPAKIDRLYVFGDIYSDQGEGYLDGNGPTAVVYMAQRMGIELMPSNTKDVWG